MAAALVTRCYRARHLQIRKLSFPMCASSTFSAHKVKEDENSSQSSLARPFDEIPGPRGLPFFGSLFQLRREGGIENFHIISQNRFEKYGSIYKETMFGRTTVHISGTDAAETLFRADGKYPIRPYLLPKLVIEQEMDLPIGLFNLRGEEAQRVRKGLAPKMMLPKLVQENMDNFNAVTGDLITRWRSLKTQNNSAIVVNDLLLHLFDWSTESVGTFIFDTRVGLFENPPSEEARIFIHAMNEYLVKILPKVVLSPPYYRYIKTPVIKKLIEFTNIGRDTVNNKIEEKLKELNVDFSAQGQKHLPGPSLLSYVMSRNELSPAELLSNASETFGAGVDTTSYTAQWLLYHLARNPDVQEKLYQEIDPVLKKTGFLSVEDLSKISYMKACLKESQRLTPIASIVGRITNDELLLSGFQIPAGTEVTYHNYTAGRSEKNFKEAAKFKPDRWLRHKGEHINSFTLLPFGHGPRMCIGKRVAETEIFSLVSKLIANFKLRPVDNEEANCLFSLLLVPDRPIGIVLEDRP